MGDGALAGAQAAQRVGQDRPSAGLGEGLGGPGQALAVLVLDPPGDDYPVGRCLDHRCDHLGGALAGGRDADARGPRPSVRAPGGLFAVGGQVTVGNQRLAEREVQVDGAGPRAKGGPDRAAGQLPQPARRRPVGAVDSYLDEHRDGVAVELDLVYGLAGADVTELRRTVGGADDKRHARLAGLDHRGQVVGGRRPRGADQDGGPAGCLGEPEGEKAGAAFVDLREDGEASVAAEGEQQRGRAGAGGGDRSGDPAAPELLREGAHQEVAVVPGGHDRW